jgi:hypothetical protein
MVGSDCSGNDLRPGDPGVRERGALIAGVIAVIAGIILLIVGPWILGLVVLVLGIAVAAIALREG